MQDLNGKRVAIIATDQVEESELLVPRDQLGEAGAEVSVYSIGGGPIQAVRGDTEPTRQIPVDGSLTGLGPADFDALVVPGGTVNADTLRTDPDAQRILREALESETTVAMICHGPWLLVSADQARGRRVTSYPSLAVDLRNAGAEWLDEPAVSDGPLITSRTPADLPAFVSAIALALGGPARPA